MRLLSELGACSERWLVTKTKEAGYLVRSISFSSNALFLASFGAGFRSISGGGSQLLLQGLKCLFANRPKRVHEMKINKLVRQYAIFVIVFLSASAMSFAQQALPKLQMAELTKKLQLTEQQQKQIAPLVAERDKKAEALEADKSMGKLQKLKQAMQLQTDFRNGAAKYLNADQVKKLDALQAERRAKLTKGKA